MADVDQSGAIVRTCAFEVFVGVSGTTGLSRVVDRECNRIENDGNRIVSVSHATHTNVGGSQVWTVLIAYTKAA